MNYLYWPVYLVDIEDENENGEYMSRVSAGGGGGWTTWVWKERSGEPSGFENPSLISRWGKTYVGLDSDNHLRREWLKLNG